MSQSFKSEDWGLTLERESSRELRRCVRRYHSRKQPTEQKRAKCAYPFLVGWNFTAQLSHTFVILGSFGAAIAMYVIRRSNSDQDNESASIAAFLADRLGRGALHGSLYR
jgi:hypothetical protein